MKDTYGFDFEEVDNTEGILMSPNGSRTPMQAESERMVNDIIHQNNGNNASMYGASARSAYTPGYELGFSPNDQIGSPTFYASPAHY